MKTKLTLFICTICLCMFFTQCSMLDDTGKSYCIDNPLNQEITISIDNVEHKIAAESNINVKIEYGKHELIYNEQKVKFITKPCETPAVINPTLSTYISWPEIYYYSDSETATKYGENLLNSFSKEYDFGNGEVEKVPFRLFNSLFIEGYEGKWDYNLNESLPEDITTSVKQGVNLSASMKIKLFREKDLMKHIGDNFDLPKSSYTKLDYLPAYTIVDEQYLNFDCEEAKHIGDSLKARLHTLCNSSGADMSNAYYKRFLGPTQREEAIEHELFKPGLAAPCQESNYSKNQMEVRQAFDAFKHMNAWIVE